VFVYYMYHKCKLVVLVTSLMDHVLVCSLAGNRPTGVIITITGGAAAAENHR